MKATLRMLTTLFIIVLLLPLAAHAHGGHGGFRGSIWMGPVWGPSWGGYYPYPYTYYSAPQVIIERPNVEYYTPPAPQQAEEPVFWYYCKKPEGYYPYVKQCPGGWMKVVPKPPTAGEEE